MNYYGDFLASETVYIIFNTFDSDGASCTITDLATTDIHVHKNGGTTQRSSASGYSLSIDFDGITGNHLIAIDTSDNTDAGFYTTGSDYQVRIEGVTVDTQTINAWIGSFSIQNRYMRGTDGANTIVPDVAGTTEMLLDVTNDLIDDLSGDVSDLNLDITDILDDTNEIQGKLPTNNIMGSSVKTDKDDEIDAIKLKTDDLTFTTANKVDARIDYVGDNEVTSPDDFKADVTTSIDDNFHTEAL